MKIKSGDKVRVLTGKDRNKEGKVLQVFPVLERVVVEGVNILTKHMKGRGEHAGQKIQFPSPIHVSNVQLISEKTGAHGRIGYKMIDAEGAKKKIRILRKKGAVEDIE
ncbi:50S ribosomal protein L24 [Candidatus Uhrbacteria bacterium RIFCSPHIGHO2_02_FULL_47_44]|uniref:Large ribosomal subunit protein uL24 n=1 Tax=Candidatus Uhrbacteria bacterium RIFCSPLOWO2_02_FULL_48_18 TaxID=1802408 RepID=A0A1F7V7Y8_9BACT|nr:MAG: 50S ribosomal protein L24 [Candidatus Uhrbacteria bacterium RIFCSPHIGHO2_01_FULL_47_10]OGL70950.1 MAG: 50S ribosomal protein L24 [Candidatus Uhrbacteria bacterium RIFCSPHIGHO2_02_FULL_47_44]OGL76942.1 MAG: 50S ribosomal protein L24 [Candidatus Uhrbacteria bacterium RIFCSPHIGHO2_12_FULL_47_12]OGL80725.1 MAG: 50S ribosomal protein L24 [Candidatus Uhrbacteria bacterium RIFCSPLOWO2_01_FULL_47_17]OGL86623.1 MAG: 50S ribosomal protein L24 [Candidatus Uhrbacteria bacterium RIFCSPLOWO2_02_FULL_